LLKEVSVIDRLSQVVADGFANAFADLNQRVRLHAEPLTDDEFWICPYPYGNSFGHLTLHIIGNLNYYIGAQIAGTGFVRNRVQEFTETDPTSKEETLQNLDETVDLVVATLKPQTSSTWLQAYKAEAAPDFIEDRFGIFLRCLTHFNHHLGQMIYIAKEFAQDDSDIDH
jgi:hypothetical protein